jgi:hypothetical protein
MTNKTNRRLVVMVAAILVFALIPVAVSAVGGTFTDDDTSIFEADIEWLASADVTKGCNPPTNDNFCPEDPVKRGQMAAFMRRFAKYLGAEDGVVSSADDADTLDGMDSTDFLGATDTAANADKVDGKHANDLVRVAYAMDQPGADVNVAGIAAQATVLSVSMTAPQRGYVTVTGQIGLTHNGLGAANCHIAVDDLDGNPGQDVISGSAGTELPDPQGGQEVETCSSMAGFQVEAGETYTINLNVFVLLHNVDADEGALIAHYVPFNGAGLQPLIIIIPPIITPLELAQEVAAMSPEVAARFSEIEAALGR